MTGPGGTDPGLSGGYGRVRLATRLAAELCDLAPAAWRARSYGAAVAERARVGDDVVLADAVADAWDLARTRPVPPDAVVARRGPAGTVVVANGRDWSLIASAGGPVLVLSDHSEQVARIDGDPLTVDELGVLVGELTGAARGEPPFDVDTLPSPPPLPWLRRDHADPS